MRAMCYKFLARTAIVAATLALAGCGPSAEKAGKKAEAPKSSLATPMPDVYRVRFETSHGKFTVEVHKAWAPLGAERFWRLVNLGFFDRSKIFRVKPGFVVQFGVSPDPQANQLFNNLAIKDDPVKQSNVKGRMTFATSGPGSRRTQVFINLSDNKPLDKQGFAPFGEVVEGMGVVERFYAGYGEMAPRGMGPDPSKLAVEGNGYADAKFPRLDSIQRAAVIQ